MALTRGGRRRPPQIVATRPRGILTRDLAFLINPGAGFVDVLRPRAVTVNGVSLAGHDSGRGFKAASNASVAADFGSTLLSTSDGAGSGDFSVLAIANPIASGTREMLYCSANGVQEFYFAVNGDVGLTATSGAVSPQTNTGGASGVSASGAADGRTHVYLYVRSGLVGTLYVDGRVAATGAVTAAVMWSGFSNDYVGGYSGANWGISNRVALVGGWNRALTAADATRMRSPRDTYQALFGPVRRQIWIPAAAAGTHATTGALTAAAATIAGTATHLTLHTTSGGMVAGSATIAGTATHPHTTSGGLTGGAATIAGSAAHTAASGSHDATGGPAGSAATIAGTAAHLTLHTTSGALVADAATISGSAAHFTLHDASGGMVASAASISGIAFPGTAPPSTGADGGGSRKRRRLYLGTPSKRLDPPPAATGMPPPPADDEATELEQPAPTVAPKPAVAEVLAALAPPKSKAAKPDRALERLEAALQAAEVEIRAAAEQRAREIEEEDEAAAIQAAILLLAA